MRFPFGTLAPLGAFLLAACATSNGGSAADGEAQVRAGIRAIADAAAERDVDRTLAVVSRDLRLIHPRRGEVRYDDFEAGIRAGLSGPARLSVTAEVDDVVVSGDMAVASITWRTAITAPDGTVTRRGERDQEVWRREADGKWRLLRGASFPLPAVAE
ncbi:MAG TPA: nuclear transport factor 2 family protein [Allosphingosinicella sp.]|jgi:uncharacterized protein (TIGR02246 family)